MFKRVRVIDADTGEILSGNDMYDMASSFGDEKVLYATPFIVSAQRGWTVLGMDGENLMIRRSCVNKPNEYTPCKPPSWFDAKYHR